MAISANIFASIDFGVIPFNVDFSIKNLDSDEDIAGFMWQFGDGQTSTLKSPTHTYSTYGVHTVALTIFGFSGQTHVEVEPDLIKGMKVSFREEIIKSSDSYTVLFINDSVIPPGYSADSWEWDFGDGSVLSNDPSPTHDYTSRGSFSVTQSVIVRGPLDFESEYINMRSNAVVRDPVIYNTCNKFLCMGWIRKPLFSSSGSPLYPLAISDPEYNVLGTEDAIKFEVIREGSDFRIGFMGSKTKILNKTLKIDLSDGNWHSLVYTCIDDNGTMEFLVDGITAPAESGYNADGFLYSVAYGETSRSGGGNVWAPFLYEAGQGIQLYNWRFKSGLNIHKEWVNDLLEIDKKELGNNG